jgi:hypothetical protein
MSEQFLFKCDVEDELNHVPISAEDEHWQESWCLAWFDPHTRVGGFHHIGLARNRNVADAWSWISYRGEVVQKYQNNALPPDNVDFATRIKLGPLEVSTIEPLVRRRILIRDAGVEASLDFTAVTDAVKFSADSRASHWEHSGLVEGTATFGGRTISVRGYAFQDRSWGPRDWATKETYRWAWGYFSKDFQFSVFNITDSGIQPDGHLEKGYVLEGGRQHRVVKVDITVGMGGDGVSPEEVTLTAWTDEDAAYRFRGHCDGASVHTHRSGFMMADACTNWVHGDRIGAGFVEVNELKRPNARLRAQLKLGSDD